MWQNVCQQKLPRRKCLQYKCQQLASLRQVTYFQNLAQGSRHGRHAEFINEGKRKKEWSGRQGLCMPIKGINDFSSTQNRSGILQNLISSFYLLYRCTPDTLGFLSSLWATLGFGGFVVTVSPSHIRLLDLNIYSVLQFHYIQCCNSMCNLLVINKISFSVLNLYGQC